MKQRLVTMLLAFASFCVFAGGGPDPGTKYVGRLGGQPMTTAQRLALTQLFQGEIVYDTTLGQLFMYTNSVWGAIQGGGGGGNVFAITNIDNSISVTPANGQSATLPVKISALGLSNSLASYAQTLNNIDVVLSPSGGDDTAQIQAALNLLVNGSVTIRTARGALQIGGPILQPFQSQLYIPTLAPTNRIRTLTLLGFNAAPFWNANTNDLPNFLTGSIWQSTLTGMGTNAALLRATNNGAPWGISPNAVHVVIHDMVFQTTSNLTALDLNGVGNVDIDGVMIQTGTNNSVNGYAQPTNTGDYGIIMPSNNFPTFNCTVNHTSILNHYTGIKLGEEGDISVATYGGVRAMEVPYCHHGNRVWYLGDYRQSSGIYVSSASSVILDIAWHDVEVAITSAGNPNYPAWMARTNDIYDPNNVLQAYISYVSLQSESGNAMPYVVSSSSQNILTSLKGSMTWGLSGSGGTAFLTNATGVLITPQTGGGGFFDIAPQFGGKSDLIQDYLTSNEWALYDYNVVRVLSATNQTHGIGLHGDVHGDSNLFLLGTNHAAVFTNDSFASGMAAGFVSGNGSALTSLNASALASGIVPTNNLFGAGSGSTEGNILVIGHNNNIVATNATAGGSTVVTNPATTAVIPLSGTSTTNFMFAIFPTNNNGLNVTNVVELTLTGADEIWAPTNYPGFGPPPTNHQKFEMWVYQDATGNHLPSFTTSSNSPPYYYFGSDITGVLVTTNAGKATVIAWEYDAPWTNWNCVGVLHKMGGP